eukprot:sb/3478170/
MGDYRLSNTSNNFMSLSYQDKAITVGNFRKAEKTSYYILSKLCDRDHLATTLARAIIKGTWRSPCQLQLDTKGNTILHVHSFTPVLISSSSIPSAIRQHLST